MGRDLKTRSVVGAKRAFCREGGCPGTGLGGPGQALWSWLPLSRGASSPDGCFRIHGKSCFWRKGNQRCQGNAQLRDAMLSPSLWLPCTNEEPGWLPGLSWHGGERDSSACPHGAHTASSPSCPLWAGSQSPSLPMSSHRSLPSWRPTVHKPCCGCEE